MRPEILGTKHADYFQIPAAVWNSLVSVLTAASREVVSKVAEAFKGGVEKTVGQLLDQGIPSLVYELGRDIMESILLSVRGFLGSTIRCHLCPDAVLSYERDENKDVMTRLGRVSFRRAYYHGPCGHSALPADSLLGVDGEHKILPELQEVIARFCGQAPYQRATELICSLLPVRCSHTTAERVTETIATELQVQQEAECHQAFAKDGKHLFPHAEPVPAAPVAVVSSDGGFCRVRDHSESSKQFMVGVLGTLDPKPYTTWEERKVNLESKRYVATAAGGIDPFYQLMAIEFQRMGLDRMPLLQIIGDGSESILPRLKLLGALDQEVFETLDFFHASEYVGTASKLIFRPESAEQQSWCEAMNDELLEGRLPTFFAELRARQRAAQQQGQSDTAEQLQGIHDYFDRRRHMLRYKEAIDRGLLIGSGVMEGGVRFIGKDRLHLTGMRWNVDGADSILRLRAVDASNRWGDFCSRRAARRAGRYSELRARWAA
ncbi:MAG TPA: ISKra4 family transposase [Candidatus Xenobia bacterium]|jgi:hypothetical protein